MWLDPAKIHKKVAFTMDVNNANLESPNSTNATEALYTNAIHFDMKTSRRSMLQHSSQNGEHTFHDKKLWKEPSSREAKLELQKICPKASSGWRKRKSPELHFWKQGFTKENASLKIEKTSERKMIKFRRKSAEEILLMKKRRDRKC